MTEGKTILLTGASRGIGAVTALELARAGHVVGCLSRKGQGPENLAIPADCAERLIPLAGDVCDEPSIKAALQRFRDVAGPINGIVNNAGIHEEGPAETMPSDAFEAVMRVNTTGVYAVCQAAYPYLTEAGGGLIVNLGSFFDKLGVRGNAAYCASKAAVAAVGRCLAVEWARKDIRVLTLAPGYIETDLNKDFINSEKIRKYLSARIPVGGAAGADQVGRVIAMLFSNDVPFLTGETIYLDGGQAISV